MTKPRPTTGKRKSYITKSDIIARLRDMGHLLEIAGANVFKVRAFENASLALESVSGDLAELAASGELMDVRGIGKSIFAHIEEMLETGTFADFEKLCDEFPGGMLRMMRISGVGPKKVKILYEELGVKDVAELEQAAKDDRIAALPGFGAKSQEKILRGIANLRRYGKRHLVSKALADADIVFDVLSKHRDVQRALIGGSLRRRKETVKDIDILISAKNSAAIMEQFTTLPHVDSIVAHGETKSSVVLRSGIQVDVRVVSDNEFPFAALYFTGSKEHNTDMRGRAKKLGFKLNEYGLFRDEISSPCKDETAVFEALGLDYIPPEIREASGEIEAAENHTLPALVDTSDIRGLFHVHTTYSDGGATVAEMAGAARDMGFDYLGIADHSKTAVYAGGLSEEAVGKQAAEIKALNESMGDFTIFHGIESDILEDGSLDYSDDVLDKFDFVVASVHAQFGMDKTTMTQRIVRAIENPYTAILGHPTGRLLLKREGYPLEMNVIIDAAAEHDVVIEINAHPARLDLDWRFVRVAKERGVKIAICPDAHNTPGMEDFRYGVGVARKGWLTRADVINTLNREEVATLLRNKRRS